MVNDEGLMWGGDQRRAWTRALIEDKDVRGI